MRFVYVAHGLKRKKNNALTSSYVNVASAAKNKTAYIWRVGLTTQWQNTMVRIEITCTHHI